MLACDINDIGGGKKQSNYKCSETQQTSSCRIVQMQSLDVCNCLTQCDLLYN